MQLRTAVGGAFLFRDFSLQLIVVVPQFLMTFSSWIWQLYRGSSSSEKSTLFHWLAKQDPSCHCCYCPEWWGEIGKAAAAAESVRPLLLLAKVTMRDGQTYVTQKDGWGKTTETQRLILAPKAWRSKYRITFDGDWGLRLKNYQLCPCCCIILSSVNLFLCKISFKIIF